MARPRTKGPIKNSDGRYMIHVYRQGVKAPVRIYLGDKNRSVFDRKTANEIYLFIDAAVDRGDVETVRNRIAYFRRVGVDSGQGLMWAMDDRPETADKWLAEHDPELFRDMADELDGDRHHLEQMNKSLAKLDAENRDDLIAEHLSTMIDWIGDDTAMLRKAHKQIGSILNVESKSKGDPVSPITSKRFSRTFGDFPCFPDGVRATVLVGRSHLSTRVVFGALVMSLNPSHFSRWGRSRGYPDYHVYSTRCRSKSKFARPYI